MLMAAPILTTHAQSYVSPQLQTAAQSLGISMQADSISSGQTLTLSAKDGLTVVVRKNEQGSVEHIGRQLFTDTLRMLIPSPVYDFLEFAVLNWKYRFTPNNLYLSKVKFLHGSWTTLLNEDLLSLSPIISNVDDRLYIVHWKKGEHDVAEVCIPIDYELLTNDTRRHLERSLVAQLATDTARVAIQPEIIEEKDLKIYGTEGLFILQRDTFLLRELCSHQYFVLRTVSQQSEVIINNRTEKMTFESVMPFAICSTDFPSESLANLLLCQASNIADAQLTAHFHLSDYHRDTLELPMSQLRHFLERQGCQLFFASSGTSHGQTTGMLLALDRARGYNHLFNVSMPVEELNRQQPQLKADIYLYIPLLSLEKIYGTAPGKTKWSKIPKGQKIQQR